MAELESRLERELARLTGAAVRVVRAERIARQALREHVRVEVLLQGAAPGDELVLVLRSDGRKSLPGSLPCALEAQVIDAAVDHGVPTPAVYWRTQDLLWEGATGYFSTWLAGETDGERIARAPSLARARQELPEQLAGALAAIHAITERSAPQLDLSRSGWERGESRADGALGQVLTMLDGVRERRPALEFGLHWLRHHRPDDVGSPRLLHGDFRVGNVIVASDGLKGLLDWEFAHWGDPYEDLGWVTVRDFRFGMDHLSVGGLCERDRFFTAYAEASGRPVDPVRMHWWEVLGNVRWAAQALYQASRMGPDLLDLEVVALGIRVPQIEYEVLRLIEVGPGGDGGSVPVDPPMLIDEEDEVGVVLEAIAHFLSRELQPVLRTDRRLAARARIASKLARVVTREVAVAELVDRAELARLERLLGAPDKHVIGRGDRRDRVHALRKVLASWLREGSLMPDHLRAIHQILKQTLSERLAITQPGFDLDTVIEPPTGS